MVVAERRQARVGRSVKASAVVKSKSPWSLPRPCATSAAAAQPSTGGRARVAAEGDAAQESGGERVTAAGRVDHLDREGRDSGGAVRVDDQRTVRACGGGDAADAELDQRLATLGQVGVPGEAEDLLSVGQQVVEVRQGRRDPLQDAGVAGRQQVRRSDDAAGPGVRQDLGGGRPRCGTSLSRWATPH